MVKSPIKIIDSGTAPTTENLGEGQIAFGTVDGATKLYGSDGTTVSELGGGGGSEVNSIAPLTTETPPLATGPYSISIGDRAKSTAQSSVSFGPSAVASGTASLSIGFRSNSSSPDTTAIGSFASASDSGSVSVGTRSSSASSSVSVGTGSESSNQGTAIGYGANATSTYLNSGSTSIGASASAPGLSAVAVGYGSESSADMAAAMGYNSSAAGLRSVAIGSDSAATSTDEFSIGSDSLQRRITHVSDPTNDQDAATKAYVDSKITDTGWLDVSGSGLGYLAGPWTVPSNGSFRIRKFGTHVTVSGIIQCTEDIAQGDQQFLLSISQSDSHFNELRLPDNGSTEIPRACGGMIYITEATSTRPSFQAQAMVSISYNGKALMAYITVVDFLYGYAKELIPNGSSIEITFSWDTED